MGELGCLYILFPRDLVDVYSLWHCKGSSVFDVGD